MFAQIGLGVGSFILAFLIKMMPDKIVKADMKADKLKDYSKEMSRLYIQAGVLFCVMGVIESYKDGIIEVIYVIVYVVLGIMLIAKVKEINRNYIVK